MGVIPGWDSITSSHWWSNFYFWASIIALISLGIMEVVSHRYSERKDELAAIEQDETKKGHELEIAQLHVEAARANERAAALEKENLEIRAKVAGRRISKQQHGIIVSQLSILPTTFDIQVMSESEAGLFAADIIKTLTDAGWTVGEKTFPLGEIWTNLNIFRTNDPAATRLMAALQAAGIPFAIGERKTEKVTIMVGGKPSPF